MTPQLIAIQARMLAIDCEVEGMRSENAQRAALGQSMAYTEDSFQEKADILFSLSNDCIELIQL